MNEVHNTDVSASDSEPKQSLAERVASLEAEIEADKKSIARRFGMWGGLVALVLSILAGSLGLVDRVNDALEAHQRQIDRAQDIASKLLDSAAEIEALIAQGKLDEADAVTRVNNIQVFRHLETLMKMDKDVLADLGSGDLMAISWFSLGRETQDEAIELATLAVEVADDDVLRTEALRYLAIAQYTSGPKQNLQNARNNMQRSMQLAKNQIGRVSDGLQLNVVMSWIGYEAVFGDCDNAETLIQTHVAQLNVPSMGFERQKNRAELQMAQMGSKCSLGW